MLTYVGADTQTNLINVIFLARARLLGLKNVTKMRCFYNLTVCITQYAKP